MNKYKHIKLFTRDKFHQSRGVFINDVVIEVNVIGTVENKSRTRKAYKSNSKFHK